jgi:hypothetical protein
LPFPFELPSLNQQTGSILRLLQQPPSPSPSPSSSSTTSVLSTSTHLNFHRHPQHPPNPIS